MKRAFAWLALFVLLFVSSSAPADADDSTTTAPTAPTAQSASNSPPTSHATQSAGEANGGARAMQTASSEAAPVDAPRVAPGIAIPEVPAEFETKSLGWMRVSYPPQMRERMDPVIAGASTVREHLSLRFGQPVLSNVEVRIARSWDEMAKLAPQSAPPPKYASGVAYSSLKLVLVTLVAPYTYQPVNLEETVRHELSHVALSDAVGDHHLPRWFQEGVAIHESGELGINRAEDLSKASLWGTLIPLSDLDRFPADGYEVSVAYAESGDFVRFLMRDEDASRFQSLVSRVHDGQKFDSAIGDAYGSDLKKLEYQWKEEVARRYSAWPAFFSLSFLWVLLIVALGWGYMKKRRRHKAVMARWAKEEAFEDALIAARRAVLEGGDHETQISVVALPVVRHDGRTHTLH